MAINDIPHQLYAGGMQARDIYPEKFIKENSDMTWEESLAKKIALWIYTRSSTGNTLYGSGRVVNQGIKIQIEKASEASGGNLMCSVFSLEDELAHLSVINPSDILTIEK